MNQHEKQLASFLAYLDTHQGERLWQALRNWSGYDFIYGAHGEVRYLIDLEDTFYIKDDDLPNPEVDAKTLNS